MTREYEKNNCGVRFSQYGKNCYITVWDGKTIKRERTTKELGNSFYKAIIAEGYKRVK